METLQEFKTVLENRIQTILGDQFVVNTMISELGGKEHASLCLEIYGANPVNNIKMNSNTHMHIWAHDILNPIKAFESSYVRKELKFRKIKAKSFEDLHTKMCDWIRKRKDQMIALEASR